MVILSEHHSEGSSFSSSTHAHSSPTRGQSSSTNNHRYDVFLSFRGVDTRHSFTDHLHKALIDANITTFLDDEEIETGEDLKPELESAIKESQVSIVVLSKNYASSTWCLDELVLILEKHVTSGHIVIPIFYHVEPTHVRKQQSSFGDAMAKHRKTMEAETNADKRSQWADKMDRWNKALIEVSNLKGKDVNGRLETEFIEEIVKDIHHRLHLHVPLRSDQPLLIGMDHHINFITSWLKDESSHTADILTILGIGGIGKTYLAKHIYRLHCRDFHKHSFVEDIGRRCNEKFNGLLDIQKQLCGDISKTSSIQVQDVSVYTSKIENAVARKRVFLVLDDIDSVDQLDALLGTKGFHPGSKVIITTKEARLTQCCALFKTNIKPKHEMRFLKGLNQTESRRLLCSHAFMCNHPIRGYEEVFEKLVKYCEGHPLALKALGRSLHNQNVAYWEGCIEELKKETDSRINNVLRLSFDSLPSNNDKELFKHIACFLVGIDRDVGETILEACNINTRSGIPNLIDRCLLSIGLKNELMMHGLVQEMGKFEVRQESLDKPWKRSRIWCHEESFKVLKQKKGKKNILGLALDMRMLEKEKLGASYELETDALSNMDNLMLLQLNYVHMNGSYLNYLKELRGLCMHGFPKKSIPSDLPTGNLVALDMSYSNIESFVGCCSNPQRLEKRQKLDGLGLKDKRLFGSLKILNLNFCKQLRSLGNFDQLPALERLMVRNCTSLVEVCESIEQCVELVLIDLSYCNNLEKLPRNLDRLKKVKTLLLDGCNLVDSRTNNRDIGSLEMCKVKSISINTMTSSSTILGVPSDLKLFANSLPSSLVSLSLANSNLSVESFPMDFSCLSMLKELYLDYNPIDSIPNCVRTLPRLEILSMMNCRKMKLVEHPPRTLQMLLIDFYPKPCIEKVVFDPEMSPLWFLTRFMGVLPLSYEIEGMIKIQPLEGVEEKVLRSLGWSNFEFLSDTRVGTNSSESKIQMVYEFGIFSTRYEEDEMPSWFSYRSAGPSISFTIPSSPSKLLRGLNFCSVHTLQLLDERLTIPDHDQFPLTPMIAVNNITKNCMWIYEHSMAKFSVGEKCWVLLSHWMFGMNEMEGGDHVTMTVTLLYGQLVKECGVSLVYDDGKMDEEEEDALNYYKSWNHIIGGDLSPFQTITGQYILSHARFVFDGIHLETYHRKFVADGPSYQAKRQPWFRALSPRKPDIIGRTLKGKGESSRSHPSPENA